MADEIAALRQDPLAGPRGVVVALLIGLTAWLAISMVLLLAWWR